MNIITQAQVIYIFLIYAAIVIGISLWYKRHRTGDEYLMAQRKASAFLVGAALFTLVGGGEIVTMPALAYTYGFSAIALFVGYALGFIFLGIIASRVRKHLGEHLYLSLPDYIHTRFGALAGRLTFLISFLAFSALLLIQFTAGGQILTAIAPIGYATAVILTALVASTYLSIGGFSTVLATDVIQGFVRLLFIPLIVLAAMKTVGHVAVVRPTEGLPVAVWISFIITGIFTAASSADVWQRMYAAKSDRAARNGLFGGAFLLMVFGSSLVWLGLIARQSAQITSPDNAFTQALTALLPGWAVVIAIILILSTIMSTADTELFLVSGMLHRELLRLRGVKDSADIAQKQSIFKTRIIIVIMTILTVSFSLVFRELISIYTWLLSAILVMAPTIISSLLGMKNRVVANASLICNAVLFIVLALLGYLTTDNAYLIVIPGLVICLFGSLYVNMKDRSQNFL